MKPSCSRFSGSVEPRPDRYMHSHLLPLALRGDFAAHACVKRESPNAVCGSYDWSHAARLAERSLGHEHGTPALILQFD